MALRPSVRFEVFKRDGFTCQYCGQRVPDVVLEVDHVIPRVEGGGEEFENLVTSCFDCNRGKGRGLLDDRAPVRNMAELAEVIREREAQLREYHAAQAEVFERRHEQFTVVWNYWLDLWGATSLDKWEAPSKSSLQRYIDKLGPGEVMDAMDIAGAKFRWLSTNTVRYLCGVLKRKAAKLDGLVVPCGICRKDVLLDPGDDKSGVWYHADCLEEREKKGG